MADYQRILSYLYRYEKAEKKEDKKAKKDN